MHPFAQNSTSQGAAAAPAPSSVAVARIPVGGTNIHYPTDATLLADGVRLLTHGLQRLGQRVRQRARSVARRMFEIAQRSRRASHRAAPAVREESKARMKVLYQGLIGITRALVRRLRPPRPGPVASRWPSN